MRTSRLRSNHGGSLVALFVMLAVVGAGVFGLFHHRKTMEREARAYANEAAERLLFAHDQKYLADNLSGAAQYEFPPSRQEYLITKLVEKGEPARPVNFEGDVNFESYFTSPSATLRARLLFFSGPATFYLNISHPGEKWRIDYVALTWEPARPAVRPPDPYR